MRHLFALAYFALGGYWAYVLHTRLLRAYGRSRLGRLVAYVPAALCYGLGAGVTFALWDAGRHQVRGAGYHFYTRTTLAQGLTLGLLLGVIGGVGLFLRGERKGGEPLFRDAPPTPEFPPEYVRELLAVEPQSSARERANMARYLQKRSRKTGQPLPPDLVAFVERNAATRWEHTST